MEEQKLIQQIALLEQKAKQFMSKEAISRYGNLKLAHPELALKAIAAIVQAAELGQLSEPLSDVQFKELLLQLREGKKSYSFRITRK